MCRNCSVCLGVVLMVVGSLLTSSTYASAIPITNHDFSSQSLADGVPSAQNSITGWNCYDSQSTGSCALIPGSDTYNPSAGPYYYNGADNNGVPTGAGGTSPNVASLTLAPGEIQVVYQDLGYTIEPGTYTLTAAVGAIKQLRAALSAYLGFSTSLDPLTSLVYTQVTSVANNTLLT